jgi:hypothetical protein
MKTKKYKIKNIVAKDLALPCFRQRITKDKTRYDRKKEKQIDF